MSSSLPACLLDSARPPTAEANRQHSERELLAKDAPQYLCAACLHAVASPEHHLTVTGAIEHVRTNPAGITFRVLCFSAAPGALRAGTPTLEDTFFPPHAWSFGVCRGCHAHLGWHYSAIGSAGFWGLIRDHLVLARPASE